MVEVFLKGEKVSLGVLERESYKKVMKLDLEVQQFLGWGGKMIPVDEIIEERYRKAVELMQKGEFYLFPIVLNESGEVIGFVSVDVSKTGVGGVGMYLLKDFWSRGYGTEALKLLCFYAFVILKIRKLKLQVFTFNERAIKCYKKVGFREVGILKEEFPHMGEYRDTLIMELLAKEFIEKNGEFVEKIKKENNLII